MNTLDYSIEDWMNSSKTYDPQLDLEYLSKLSKKKLRKEAKLKVNDDGRIVISQRKKKYIDLNEYYGNPDKYFNDLYFFIYLMDNDILDEICRENYISFVFPRDKTEKIYHLSTIHFVFNMITWLPFFILGIKITKDKVFMPKHFTNKSYIDYLNNKIIEPYKHLTTHNEMSKMLAKMYDLFQRISDLYGLKLGISFSMYDIIEKWDNPELYEISHKGVPSHYQIAEMESFFTSQAKRFIEIHESMDDDPNDSIKTMLRAGQLNIKQLREFVVSIGTKPDLQGDTYSHIPSPGANLVAKGLRNPEDYTIECAGNRKTAMLALNIDDGGYMARVFGKSCCDVKLCEDPDYDCGSENYYVCTIHDKKDLKNMRGRYYLVEETNTLRQLTDTDYDMIGKTLKFRSPVTCAGGEKGICAVCYGYLYNQNVGINIGINSSLRLTESNYQLLMSAKHILDTKTTVVMFNSEFYDFFVLETDRVILRNDIEDIENYEIWININCIYKDKEDIEDMSHNEYIKEFIIYDKQNGVKIEIADESNCELYLANQIFDILKYKRRTRDYSFKGWMKFPLSDFTSDRDMFFLRLKNDELTRSLKELKLLIEKGADIGISDVSQLIDKLKYLMASGGISTETIHIEVLCRNLVRDKHNKISLPDWSKPDPEYMITSIHNSIFWSNSVINSLTFEKIKIQLRDPLTYMKTGTSFFDPFFILDYNKQNNI